MNSFIDKIYDEILPNALMIGVDYDLFWTLNPKSLSSFIKAFVLRQNYDDMIAWTNGYYIRLAIGSCLSKETKYPKSPLSSTPKIVDENSIQNDIKAKMFRQMKIVNSRYGKEVLNE